MTSKPPSKTFENTKEKENYWCLLRLLMGEGTDALKILFDGFIPPSSLPSQLKKEKSRLQKLLRHEQYITLFLDGGKYGKSKDFDITLLSRLFALFRLLPKPRTGWNNLPNDNDETLEADFLRIKLYRNEYVHSKERKLDDATFNDVWEKVSHALVRIVSHVDEEVGKEWKKEIANRKKTCTTPEEKKRLEEIVAKMKQLFEETLQPIVIKIWSSYFKPCLRAVMCQEPEPKQQEPDSQEITNEVITREVVRVELQATEPPLRYYLQNSLGATVLDVQEGSLLVFIECNSLEILQRVWEDYRTGHLNKMAEKLLVTQELLDKFKIEEVRLSTFVDPDEYEISRQQLIMLELGNKVYPDREDIIRDVETLIEKGDLPTALRQISDWKEQQKSEEPLQTARLVIKSGADVDHTTKDGTFPLMIASYKGLAEVAKELLDCGAEVNRVDKFGRTALHVASRCGHVDVVNVLVQHGASLDLQNKFGKTPLQLAKQKNRSEVVKILLDYKAKDSFQLMKLRQLACEALVKISDQKGYNLLHHYCMDGNSKAIKDVLINHFIPAPVFENCRTEELNARSCREIVSEADTEGQKVILQILDEAKNDWESLSELHKAVEQDDVEEVISLVVDQSMNINTVANRNESALHWASVNGSADVVSALIELGSDISAQTNERITPLHKACLHNNCSVAYLLIEEGTSPSEKTTKEGYEGFTSLHLAAMKNASITADLLVKRGAKLSEANAKGQTALHIAAQYGKIEVVNFFCENATKGHVEILEKSVPSTSADAFLQINRQDNLGFTALHRAAENNRIDVVKKLIGTKAAVEMQTKQNLSERIYLVRGKCDGKETWMYLFVHKFKIALFNKKVRSGKVSEMDIHEFGQEILAGYGEKPNDDLHKFIENEASNFIFDDANETPLHLASRKGHNEIVQQLLKANGDMVYRPDAEGFLPFHTAIMYGNRETVKHLLKCSPSLTGESVEVCSTSDKEPQTLTPIDLAEANEVDMEDILKKQEEVGVYVEKTAETQETIKGITKVHPKLPDIKGTILNKLPSGTKSEQIDTTGFNVISALVR